jgi:hypothetical protein
MLITALSWRRALGEQGGALPRGARPDRQESGERGCAGRRVARGTARGLHRLRFAAPRDARVREEGAAARGLPRPAPESAGRGASRNVERSERSCLRARTSAAPPRFVPRSLEARVGGTPGAQPERTEAATRASAGIACNVSEVFASGVVRQRQRGHVRAHR